MRVATAVLFLSVAALLALPADAEAQNCLAAGSSAQFCDDPGAACSPPAGGTCRQVTDNNGAPDGCICSALAAGYSIVKGEPGGGGGDYGRTHTYLIIVIILLIVILVFVWWKCCRKPHPAGG